ncbi:MAG: EamA/RhaT family transporter [Paracoccaceae bacterium]
MAWLPLTLLAATLQACRHLLSRRQRAAGLPVLAATWMRFGYGAPLVAGALGAALALGAPLPAPTPAFWGWAMLAGAAQMAGTAALIALMQARAFAVGVTLAKTEVIQTALLGAVLLSEGLSPTAWVAIGLGFTALAALSPPGRLAVDRTVMLGLAAGAGFALAAVSVRGATLALEGPAIWRAAVALMVVTGAPALALGAWLAATDRAGLRGCLSDWRGGLSVGALSVLGSLAWFTAFALQTAAVVKAVGQVEVLISALLGRREGDRLTAREGLGMALLAASVVAVALSG